MVAVVILNQTDLVTPLFVLGLLGTLSSLTLLQSFSLSVGGEKLASLEPLLIRFRQDILSDNSSRIAHSGTKRWYSAISKLAQVKEASLVTEFETLVVQLSYSGDLIRERLNSQLDTIPTDLPERRQSAYAVAIVEGIKALDRPGILSAVVDRYSEKRRRWFLTWIGRSE